MIYSLSKQMISLYFFIYLYRFFSTLYLSYSIIHNIGGVLLEIASAIALLP